VQFRIERETIPPARQFRVTGAPTSTENEHRVTVELIWYGDHMPQEFDGILNEAEKMV